MEEQKQYIKTPQTKNRSEKIKFNHKRNFSNEMEQPPSAPERDL